MAPPPDPANVQRFLEADKVVVVPEGVTSIGWSSNGNCHRDWRAQVAFTDGQVVGEVFSFVNVAFPRHWSFKVTTRGVEALRMDIAAPPVNHNNGEVRPPYFPKRCRSIEHEHLWARGGTKATLARPLCGLVGCDHEYAWQVFCTRARIRSTVTHASPFFGFALTLPVSG